jgi:hypothetical protein
MHCQEEMAGRADYVLSKVLSRSKEELSKLLYGVSIQGTRTYDAPVFRDHWQEFEGDTDVEVSSVKSLETVEWDPDFVDLEHPVAADAVAYLYRRHVPLWLAHEYGLRYNPRERRVVIPSIIGGELKGWQARAIDPTKGVTEEGEAFDLPKILTKGNIKQGLMFQDRIKGSPHVVWTEGPFDAIQCHLCGGNFATMGKAMTDAQVDIVKASGASKLYIGLDDDAAGEINKVIKIFSNWKIYRLLPPRGREDLGDCTIEEVLERFKRAPQINAAQVFVYVNEKPKGCAWGA